MEQQNNAKLFTGRSPAGEKVSESVVGGSWEECWKRKMQFEL